MSGGNVRKTRKRLRKKHFRNRNYHHLLPRVRGGKATTSNLLLIGIDKHRWLHKIFGNRTLDEIIAILQRLQRAKRRQ
jgi:hypothetical protein